MAETKKSPEDIMAECLLTGGKMLADICPACSAPLFEINGKRTCVICDGKEQKEPVKNVNPENIAVIMPKYAAPQTEGTAAPEELTASLDSLILQFCKRAETEPDPARCLTYMECIRMASETRTILRR